MAIREGAWDCPHCGNKRNRGPEKHCPACGSARGPEVKFYLPDDAPVVTDRVSLARAKAGPDWSCQYCDTDNPHSYAFCSSCGASSEGAPPRGVVEHRFKVEPPPESRRKELRQKGRKGKRKTGCCAGCAAVFFVGFFGFLLLSLFIGGPKKDTIVVEGHRWERAIEIQTLVTETQTAWEGEVPQGARILSRQREIHHHDRVQIGTETKSRNRTERVQIGTEKVKVGVRDLGNGYFEDIFEDRPVYEERTVRETYEDPVYREDPVYKIRLKYEIDQWKRAREKVLSGGIDQEPVWPDVKLGPREREGRRRELYEVLFRDSDGRPRYYRASGKDSWQDFDVGARFRAEIDGRSVTRIFGPA